MSTMKNNKTKIELDDDQKFALMKFRRSVHDVLQPHHDDHFLLRWLRARSWNAEAAEKMLRESMKWRLDWECDGALKTWQPPEVISLYQPSGLCGFDKDGAPVIVVPFCGLDIVGMLHSIPKQALIKATIQMLEKNLAIAAERGHHQVVVIFDMEHFNLRQYLWRPATEVVIQMLQMYEANYPETLKVCFIINAPTIFAMAFNIVKKFMDAYTLSKIEIIKQDPAKWKKAILQQIDPDNLPAHFGGNLTDPDGNPRLTTKVKQGGKIPKSFYVKNVESVDTDEDYISATVKKGDKLTLKFDVETPGSFLRWDFRTESHDIRFGVTVEDSEGQQSQPVRSQRVSAHQMDEIGALACQAPATYTVTFDNSYSMLRSKKLRYRVYVAPPLEDLGIKAEEAEAMLNTLNNENEDKKNLAKGDCIEDDSVVEKLDNMKMDEKSIVSPVH